MEKVRKLVEEWAEERRKYQKVEVEKAFKDFFGLEPDVVVVDDDDISAKKFVYADELPGDVVSLAKQIANTYVKCGEVRGLLFTTSLGKAVEGEEGTKSGWEPLVDDIHVWREIRKPPYCYRVVIIVKLDKSFGGYLGG